MIRHHPGDDLLLRLAAGRLDSAAAFVLSTHVEACVQCRTRLREFEALGGAMLEDLEPRLLATQSLAGTLEKIDRPAAPAVPAPLKAPSGGGIRAALPGGQPWPAAMQGCMTSPWRWIAPGMRFSRVTLPYDPMSNVFLLRISPGSVSASMHTHSDTELTQVICGSFDDGIRSFSPGDFDAADAEVRHAPRAVGGGDCVCLAAVSGNVLFEGRLARWVASLIGI